MFKPWLKGVLLLTGIFPGACGAEEFVLRTEEVVFEAVDQDDFKRIAKGLVVLDKSKGTTVDSLELYVKSGEHFYGTAMGRQKAVEIQGKLEPGAEPGQVDLDISVAFTTYMGTLIPQAIGPPVELTEATTLQAAVGLTDGKPQILGGFATSKKTQGEAPGAQEHECRCIYLTLEAVRLARLNVVPSGSEGRP